MAGGADRMSLSVRRSRRFPIPASTAFFSFWAVSPEMSHLRPILELFRLSEHSPFGRIMLESGDQPVVFREAEVSYTIKGP